MIPTGTGFNSKQEEMLRIDSSARFVSIDVSVSNFTCAYNGVTGHCRAIFVGVTGNLVIKNSAGTSVTFTNVVPGVIYPLSTNTVVASGTTATGIIAIF